VPASDHPFPSRSVAVAAIFFLLAGCGIKSGLEQPQPARLAEPAAADNSATRRVTDKEASKVVSGRAYNLLPPETPPEWKQERDRKKPASFSKAGNKSTVPEKPFILDSLL
jgi:predicted small lipoprotein YifL